jgi:hypothetical protein
LDKLNFIRRWFNRTRKLSIGDTVITYELADTPAKRSQGLSGRSQLSPDHGMLFIFSTPSEHAFWMKDMNFPLDIIWLKDNQVVDISQNVLPPENPSIPPVVIRPKTEINQVLEVVSGFTSTHHIQIGDNLSIF